MRLLSNLPAIPFPDGKSPLTVSIPAPIPRPFPGPSPATYLVTGNGSFDYSGVKADPYGLAGTQSFPITFKPPSGMAVQICQIYGDFCALPTPGRGSTTGSAVACPGGFTGVLFGMSRSDSSGSLYADLAADGCMLYIQDFSFGEARRLPYSCSPNMLLAADNKLIIKTAVFMNTLGVNIHMEPSFNIVIQFVPAPVAAVTTGG